MTHPLTITLQMKLKPSSMDVFLDALPLRVSDTLAFTGALSMRVVRQHDDPLTVLFIEEWDSIDSFNLYLAWRSQRDDMSRVGELLSEIPTMNVWSTMI